MSNSNIIYTNIRYNNSQYDNDNENDNDNDNDNENDYNENNLETTTFYYLMDYINRTR